MNIAIILAAGNSTRMGGVNKILLKIKKQPLIYWTLSVFERCKQIDAILVIGRKNDLPALKKLAASKKFNKVKSITAGGANRQESFLSGFQEAKKYCSEDRSIVLVHDGARPFVSVDLIGKIIDAAKKSGAAIPALPVTETIKFSDRKMLIKKTLNRKNLWLAQTPQSATFLNFNQAIKYVRKDTLVTDEAGLLEHAKIRVKIIPGEITNVKITTPEDLKLALGLI